MLTIKRIGFCNMYKKDNMSRISLFLIRIIIILDAIILIFDCLSGSQLMATIPYIGIISFAAVIVTPLIINRIIKSQSS